MAVPDDMELLLGNGSDELIQILALAVNRPGAVLMSVEPSFVMFRMVATSTGIRYVGVPLTPEFSLDAAASAAPPCANTSPALTFIAYPNNPTGNLFDADAIRAVIEASPGLVVVDEAYHAFAGRSFLPELARYPNLLVMRTLSKLGLAGLRLGMLIGRPEWLSELDKLRLPYNVNVLTQRIAALRAGAIGRAGCAGGRDSRWARAAAGGAAIASRACTRVSERREFHPVSGAAGRRGVRGPEGAWRSDQESEWLPPEPDRLPARDGRYAEENDQFLERAASNSLLQAA